MAGQKSKNPEFFCSIYFAIHFKHKGYYLVNILLLQLYLIVSSDLMFIFEKEGGKKKIVTTAESDSMSALLPTTAVRIFFPYFCFSQLTKS